MGFAHVTMIGLGEVGSIFAEALKARGVGRLTAYDPLFSDPASKPSAHAARLGIAPAASANEALAGADLAISAVTAAQALAAAHSAVSGIGKDTFFLDLNSASPGVKAAAGQAIEAAGGRYVEAAVMSSVPPKGLATPMLLGGRHAQAFLDETADLDLDAKVFSETVGLASATKMCRSVMVKGLEALFAECLLTARHYGVDGVVLESLSDTLPGVDVTRLGRYMISRSLIHGKRRAEEMREAARTVQEAGVDPLMASAAAERQDWAWQEALRLPPGTAEEQDLGRMLDAIRKVFARAAE